ncbi:MAG: T9SS type A sorting domain-containing protein [Bacteroidota bacterium]
MKSIFLFFFISLLGLGLQAQNMNPNVVCSAAATQSNSSMTVTWQLGNFPFILHPASGETTDDSETEEAFQIQMSVYPNPAVDQVNLQFETPFEEEIEVQVTDAQGRVWASVTEAPFATQLWLDTQHLPKGIYSIHIYAGEERMAVRQLIKAE